MGCKMDLSLLSLGDGIVRERLILWRMPKPPGPGAGSVPACAAREQRAPGHPGADASFHEGRVISPARSWPSPASARNRRPARAAGPRLSSPPATNQKPGLRGLSLTRAARTPDCGARLRPAQARQAIRIVPMYRLALGAQRGACASGRIQQCVASRKQLIRTIPMSPLRW